MTTATMPDSSEVDDAVLDYLAEDETLAALLPDGVAWDLALQNATAFVIVSQLAHEDNHVQGGVAACIERFRYLVKAVHKSSSGLTTKDAARRIQELLNAATSLAIPGYVVMRIDRAERVRYTEVDQTTLARWQHRGGQYDVWVTPLNQGMAE